MKQLLATVFALAISLPSGAQDRPPTAAPAPASTLTTVDGIVAIVGSRPIFWSEVMEVVGQERSRGAPMPEDSAGAAEFARTILVNLTRRGDGVAIPALD